VVIWLERGVAGTNGAAREGIPRLAVAIYRRRSQSDVQGERAFSSVPVGERASRPSRASLRNTMELSESIRRLVAPPSATTPQLQCKQRQIVVTPGGGRGDGGTIEPRRQGPQPTRWTEKTPVDGSLPCQPRAGRRSVPPFPL
jgi:hypothetical protein